MNNRGACIGEAASGRVRLISTEEKTANVPQESILGKAHRAVFGDRSRYGHPLDNHGCTAVMWAAYIARKHGIQVPLDAEDVCHLNILQKISREANAPHEDTLVDIAGYALNVELVRGERQRRDRRDS